MTSDANDGTECGQTTTPHRFEECPDCGGDLQYQTQCDVMCLDCEALFDHEIRGTRHLLWRFTHEDGLTEVVSRAE